MEGAARKEKGVESNGNEESSKDEVLLKTIRLTLQKLELGTSSLTSPTLDTEKDLECARGKMIEAREENKRLRKSLTQITNDYQTLQMQYNDIIARGTSRESNISKSRTQNYKETDESDHLISLSLGRASSSSERVLKNEVVVNESKEGEKEKEGLSLGLDCKYEISTEISVKPNPEHSGELGEGERELAKKGSSFLRSEDDEVSDQKSSKRARVSVRVRCDYPTMNDGCQWRKYGQKISKGNPCPRAYYRCTVAPSCPVRKQVQRCSEDMNVLITTYEGTHNHPLPPSATAIASTTSAAASMLLSGSSTSPLNASSSSHFHNFHGLNYNPYDLSKSKQIYVPNNSTSFTNPTITLDLTSHSSSSIFNSNYFSTPKDTSTNLSFNPLESNPLPSFWNGTHQVGNSLNFGGQNSTQQNVFKTVTQNPNPNTISHQQTLAPDAIAAATKAITSDPGFQSALVTALSSIIGNKRNGKDIVEAYPGVTNLPPTSTQNGYNFSSNYLSRNPNVTGSQQGSMVHFQPQSRFDSTSKSKSSSPSDDDHTL